MIIIYIFNSTIIYDYFVNDLPVAIVVQKGIGATKEQCILKVILEYSLQTGFGHRHCHKFPSHYSRF